jgi:hypothetical protein
MSKIIDNKTIITLTVIMALAISYAVTRYVLSGSVLPENIPAYIINKAVSLSAAIAIFLSAIAYLANNNLGARNWGIISFHLAAIHILLSMSLWGEGYFESYYYVWGTVDGKIVNVREHYERMTLTGELTMLFGVLGAYSYFMLFRAKHGTMAMACLKLIATFCIAVHIGVTPYQSWRLGSWGAKFDMPPISLLGFLCVALAFLIYLRLKDVKKTEQKTK